MKLKKYGIVAGMSLALVAAGCGTDEEDPGTETGADEESSEESTNYGEELDYTITGIEPGAGIMSAAEEAVEAYELEDWDISASSSAAMTQALGTAYENEEPVIVTGWTPHWKFAAYDLKYLEDPEGIFGEAEDIHTFAREGLEEEKPEAYTVLENFHWTEEDMGEIMMAINEGQNEAEAAAEWVENNQDKVSEWTEGVSSVEDEEIELIFVAWDSEIASTNMIGKVLEDIGYDVTMTPTEAPYMFQAVATGEADAMVAAWLPLTHAHLLDDYEDDMVDLGVNLEGARTGLVVPEYMDIDSIEDLK
ncbi:glycine betaine ABC transporter substrate-binding protein [Alteribacter keqinensis]|uniref:Glycine/betaine ABC transporter n=1 Tax=Alteribacter keqinensis TaxID=2483800 RepID=A0A3M7TPK4_9BACI|nr:glycine betaine ABC transporter substrate-binding protein [Alteribacter keqinensis]RNA67478.1 glycine/betaine ABC transporter [Alteribacter keqinensis]